MLVNCIRICAGAPTAMSQAFRGLRQSLKLNSHAVILCRIRLKLLLSTQLPFLYS